MTTQDANDTSGQVQPNSTQPDAAGAAAGSGRRMYTLEQASALIGVARATLARWQKEGRVQGERRGKHWVYSSHALDELRGEMEREAGESVVEPQRERAVGMGDAEVTVTAAEPAISSGGRCTSLFRGVCWEQRTKSWVAQIGVDGQQRRIGRFNDEVAAAEAYDGAALAAWSDRSRLNFPDGVDAWMECASADVLKRIADERAAVAAAAVWPLPGWVEKAEVARLCGVATQRVWKWELRGRLTGGRMVLKPGTQGLVKVFPEAVVRRLVDEKRGMNEAPFPPEGFVDTDGAAAFFGISPTTLHVWSRNGTLSYAGELVKRPNGTCKIYSVAELERARDELSAAEAEAATLPDGFVGRRAAANFLDVTTVTLIRWEHEGFIRCGTWIEHPAGSGARRKVYPLAELDREREEMEAARADRSKLPEGFVDQEEACQILGVSVNTLIVWQREGKVDFAQWGRSRTYKPCRIYALDDLDRFMERMRESEAIRDRENPGEYHIPLGYVRQLEAAHLFGVEYATFHRWELEGRITCGTQEMGAGIKLYPIDELKRLLEECGKYSPPYPDPERPGVYRVPLSGWDIVRREAIIDAADLPLIEGRRWHWSERGEDQLGQVVISGQGETIRLRQVIMGVSGIEWRVGHRNGDPLDCRRENLFVRTKQEQAFGSRKMKGYGGQPCSSRFKGVCWDKQTGKWRAVIRMDGKSHSLGRFRDEIAAAEAYDKAAREMFGVYARLNFPDGIDAWLRENDYVPQDPATDFAAREPMDFGCEDDDSERAARAA